MDFFEDVFMGFQQELLSEGVSLPTYSKLESVVLFARIAEYKMRRISMNKRKVFLSNELSNSNEYSQNKIAVDNLKHLTEAGASLTPYQSKKIDSFDYSELLLFDWGIHHLHLGQHQAGQSFRYDQRPSCLHYTRNLKPILFQS